MVAEHRSQYKIELGESMICKRQVARDWIETSQELEIRLKFGRNTDQVRGEIQKKGVLETYKKLWSIQEGGLGIN